MFETPFTRRQMLEVVQKSLLPWAWSRDSDASGAGEAVGHKRLLLLQPPLQLPPAIKVVERVVDAAQMRRGKPAPGRGSFASHILWPELGLHSMPFAWFGFLYQGEIDLRIGASRSLVCGPQGEGRINIVTMQAPTFFVIPPGVPHPDGNHIPWERPLPLLKQEVQMFWIHVSPAGLRCHLSRVAQGRYQEEFFVLLKNEALLGLAKLLLAELQRPQRFTLVVEAALLSLVLEINQSLLESGMPGTTEAPQVFELVGVREENQNERDEVATLLETHSVITEEAKRFIEMHLNWKTLTLDAIAHHVHVSPSHLNRLFKAQLGVTVKEYIQQSRIHVAKTLLEESDMAIAEVGFLVGFFPPSHFARAFSQAVGVTPKKFRNARRTAQLERLSL